VIAERKYDSFNAIQKSGGGLGAISITVCNITRAHKNNRR
jgi:hypothetical protein